MRLLILFVYELCGEPKSQGPEGIACPLFALVCRSFHTSGVGTVLRVPASQQPVQGQHEDDYHKTLAWSMRKLLQK
jgi:hypothetical protein